MDRLGYIHWFLSLANRAGEPEAAPGAQRVRAAAVRGGGVWAGHAHHPPPRATRAPAGRAGGRHRQVEDDPSGALSYVGLFLGC